MLRVHRIPLSTNVARIALAAGLKGVAVEWVDHDPDDRSAIRALSGQELVPVVETGAEVLTDSPQILLWLEERHPEPPLLPADPARRREVLAFCDWFNHVWKLPPNAIDAQRRAGHPDDARVAAWAEQLRAAQRWFEALLAGRDFLLGDEVTLADVTAHPFLRFTTAPEDDDLFHGVLCEHLPGELPRLAAWVARVDALPRA
ncbi:glutathione S-transferase family protein [Conexibacter sp. SYSU D00693]|uniref:glutathione S-transferase family protein n=1 Tax=Conexibacter sp. SYSU D00693 TaxID=2812560 RepID=UPI00196A37B7|nr:glutathione S-transferase family protein [Conexibacter sp. SYSU D00693]